MTRAAQALERRALRPRVPTALRWMGAALALALVGCGAPERSASTRPSRLQQILDAGELRVGTSADLPPLSMRNRQGEIVGLEIDLVRALADAMKIEIRLIEEPFAELLSALENGELDLVVAGLTITPERNARVAFAGPYFISGASLLSASQQIAEVASAGELDDPARRLVALEASTNLDFVREHMPRAQLTVVPDNDTGVQMVMGGEADALVADLQVCTLASWRHPEAGLHARLSPFTTEPLGIALPPDAPLLLNLVSNYLGTLESTGELALLKARWLARGDWVEDLP